MGDSSADDSMRFGTNPMFRGRSRFGGRSEFGSMRPTLTQEQASSARGRATSAAISVDEVDVMYRIVLAALEVPQEVAEGLIKTQSIEKKKELIRLNGQLDSDVERMKDPGADDEGSWRTIGRQILSFYHAADYGSITRDDLNGLLARDGDIVFSYNAHALHSWGVFYAAAGGVFLRVFSRELHRQALVLCALALLFGALLHLTGSLDHGCKKLHASINIDCSFDINQSGMLALVSVEEAKSHLQGLCTFVLGLFTSLALGRTYYSNRALLGTVFAKVLGLGMFTSTFVRPCDDSDEATREARATLRRLVRWGNAGFRLLWLESLPGLSAEETFERMEGLLLAEEWAFVAELPSRATYVFQWMCDLCYDAHLRGLLRSEHMLVKFVEHIEALRGANVWGLPSLPYPYVLLVTLMVKTYLILEALTNGYALGVFFQVSHEYGFNFEILTGVVGRIVLLVITNTLFQGLLDLHSLLRNPNRAQLCGHMPTELFLDFTKRVTTNLIEKLDERPHARGVSVLEDEERIRSARKEAHGQISSDAVRESLASRRQTGPGAAAPAAK